MEQGVQVTVNAAEGAGVARLALPARNRAAQTWEAAVRGLGLGREPELRSQSGSDGPRVAVTGRREGEQGPS